MYFKLSQSHTHQTIEQSQRPATPFQIKWRLFLSEVFLIISDLFQGSIRTDRPFTRRYWLPFRNCSCDGQVNNRWLCVKRWDTCQILKHNLKKKNTTTPKNHKENNMVSSWNWYHRWHNNWFIRRNVTLFPFLYCFLLYLPIFPYSSFLFLLISPIISSSFSWHIYQSIYLSIKLSKERKRCLRATYLTIVKEKDLEAKKTFLFFLIGPFYVHIRNTSDIKKTYMISLIIMKSDLWMNKNLQDKLPLIAGKVIKFKDQLSKEPTEGTKKNIIKY